MINALEYVCLAGTVNKDQRDHALAVCNNIDTTTM